MTVTTAASSPAIAAATVPGIAQQALSDPQAVAPAQGGAGSPASSQVVIGMSSTTSAAGVITTVITYANGSTATMTSSGPMPSSTLSIVV